jgi:hypothetical protein
MRSPASSFPCSVRHCWTEKLFVHDIFGKGCAQKQCASAQAADLKARFGAARKHYKHMKDRWKKTATIWA